MTGYRRSLSGAGLERSRDKTQETEDLRKYLDDGTPRGKGTEHGKSKPAKGTKDTGK